MAAVMKHSYDEKRIRKYVIGKHIKNGIIINIRSEQDMRSYFNALENGAIYNYDGSNIFIARVDPYTATLVGSIIEKGASALN
jgi:hypothetical protein